jgi:glycerate kinase
MHVLIAPRAFTGTLTAAQAAAAIAHGWARRLPDDRLTLRPMTDGGPGFVDTLAETLDGELVAATVRGPLGDPAPGAVLLVGDTAYVEAAQACGAQLAGTGDAEHASSFGVGELVVAAVEAGARRVVVGTGGCVANDGGAGLLAALGATADVPLDQGPAGLAGIASVELVAARERVAGVHLVAATDSDVPLLGLFGVTKAQAARRGIAEERVPAVDGWLDAFVVACLGPSPAQRRPADAPGAGAGGGLGFALTGCLGGERVIGIELAADVLGLAATAATCDLVLTGEGTYDFASRSGSVVHAVAQLSQDALRPCVVLAGRVVVGSREMRAMGVESAYSVVELLGEEAALSDPADSLATLAHRVARTWGRRSPA